jgi:outer membrane protein assembly factor BamB
VHRRRHGHRDDHRARLIRWLCILALAVACEAPAEISKPAQANPNAPPASWPLGRAVGHIGREVAPQVVGALTLDGDLVRGATLWQVPGDGAARAVAGSPDAVELIDIDRRRVAWRASCGGPVVGVTGGVIVCAAQAATRALHLDGSPAWQIAEPFVAMTGDRVVTDAGTRGVALHDSATGGELAAVVLPVGMPAQSVVAACDRDLYAVGSDDKLARIAGKLVWSTLLAPGDAPVLPGDVDPCAGSSVLAIAGGSLVAVARDTGKIAGRIDGVRGVWPSRAGDGRVEVATGWGVLRVARELPPNELPGRPPGEVLALPALGASIASRGDRRLVRATPSTAVLLDARGIRAFVPLAEATAAIGGDAIVAASSPETDAELRLFALPLPWRRALRLPAHSRGIALSAELRDLPAGTALEGSAGIALTGTGSASIDATALDPIEPAIYAASGGLVARFDLAARAWTWSSAGACPPGVRVQLAVSRSVVACGTRDGGVTATTRDGARAWRSNVPADSLDAAADVVVAHTGDRVRALDASDGHVLGTVATAHAAALDIAGMALVITAEANRVVARLPRAYMLPAWSIEARGVVRAIAASGDGAIVELEGGDAYRIDARTAAIVALPDVGLAWHAIGDLVAGATAGGPVPPNPMPVPPRPLVPEKYKPVDLEAAPAIATPWPPPPPMAASWQLALFELAGGVRARDDYALAPPIALAERRGASPIVVEYGARPRHMLVLDAVRGDPLRRIELPADAPEDTAFSTVVDGRPVTGTILADPLRVVTF